MIAAGISEHDGVNPFQVYPVSNLADLTDIYRDTILMLAATFAPARRSAPVAG